MNDQDRKFAETVAGYLRRQAEERPSEFRQISLDSMRRREEMRRRPIA